MREVRCARYSISERELKVLLCDGEAELNSVSKIVKVNVNSYVTYVAINRLFLKISA